MNCRMVSKNNINSWRIIVLFCLIEAIIFICYSLYMSKFNSYNNQPTHSTTTHSPNNNQPQYVSPFTTTHSPNNNKLESSPLQIPLAIAISRLANKQRSKVKGIDDGGEGRPKREGQREQQMAVGSEMLNLQNVLEQFAESLYCSMQKQIYSKFNVEMKRLVLKYRQTEGLLHRVSEKLILNADVIELQCKNKAKGEWHKRAVWQLEAKIERLEAQMQSLQKQNQETRRQLSKVQKQNKKLKENNEKYENTLMNFVEQLQQHKKHENNQWRQWQRQKQVYRNSTGSRKPLNPPLHNYPLSPPLHNYHIELLNSQISTSLSQNHIQNINQLAPTHSPIKKQSLKHSKPHQHLFLRILEKE